MGARDGGVVRSDIGAPHLNAIVEILFVSGEEVYRAIEPGLGQ